MVRLRRKKSRTAAKTYERIKRHGGKVAKGR